MMSAGNVVELIGETTVPHSVFYMSNQIEANIPHAKYAHDQLDKLTTHQEAEGIMLQ